MVCRHIRSTPTDRPRPFASLIEKGVTRPADVDLTLFKAMGTGLSDMAFAVEIPARARQQGLGHPVSNASRFRRG